MFGSGKITLKGQHLTLLPQRAVFWNEQKMLILADPHFGKAAAFRRSGVAVPTGTTVDDLDRLDQILVDVNADTLLILGDLMHTTVAADEGLRRVGQWLKSHTGLDVILVRGNHDRGLESTTAELGIHDIVDSFLLPPFEFVHRTENVSQVYSLSGHLHPAVHIAGAGRQRERLPCFCFGATSAVLPSFGSFTGHSTIHPRAGDVVFVIADNRVIAI